MHEVSLMESALAIALEQADRQKAKQINTGNRRTSCSNHYRKCLPFRSRYGGEGDRKN
ncbi:MAG: hypothetical protein WBV73_23280 [Phormidium sp.]